MLLNKIKSEKAENKAWSLLRSIMSDDQKYHALKNARKPIEVHGSLGGRYFLYPSGAIARLDEETPFIGKVSSLKNLPVADRLATIYMWITQKEEQLKKLWGCGNISLYYNNGTLSNGDGLEAASIQDRQIGDYMMRTEYTFPTYTFDALLQKATAQMFSFDYYLHTDNRTVSHKDVKKEKEE